MSNKMTVKELIAALRNLPDSSEVRIQMSDDSYGISTVTLVSDDPGAEQQYFVAICSDEEI